MIELNHLIQQNLITSQQGAVIQNHEEEKLFSIHWELRLILYLGVLLLTAGLGILIYQNIDTIGHTAILGLIALLLCACFYYIIKHKLPYSNTEAKHTSPFYDYVVLFSAFLFAVFLGYLQYQYHVFGLHYGIATLIPAIIYFVMAYVFDHKGVLLLGITGLASALGLSITPIHLLEANDYSSSQICFTAIAVGVLYECVSFFSNRKKIKSHFCFSYSNFAANLIFIGLLSLLFLQDYKYITLFLIAGVGLYYFMYAIKQKSFLFLLLSVLYGYISLTYLVFLFLSTVNSFNEGVFAFGMLYVLASCMGVVLFFVNIKKILKLK